MAYISLFVYVCTYSCTCTTPGFRKMEMKITVKLNYLLKVFFIWILIILFFQYLKVNIFRKKI